MNFYFISALSFSILIPGIIAAVSFKKIHSRYHPFLICLWIGCLNEGLSFLLILNRTHTTINNNIYVLLEAILLSWYFRRAGMLKMRSFYLIVGILLLFWTAEDFIFKPITESSPYFRIGASMLIVVLSIELINREFSIARSFLLKNADFLLCCCFIIYFAYRALIQAFIIYGVTRDIHFLQKIYIILYYVNLGVNLMYSIAIVCMPRKLRFILPLS